MHKAIQCCVLIWLTTLIDLEELMLLLLLSLKLDKKLLMLWMRKKLLQLLLDPVLLFINLSLEEL